MTSAFPPIDGASVDILPISRTLSVMLTLKCNAECKSCGTLSSPRVKGRLDTTALSETIRQAKSLGFANVVFTGGESTLYFEDLLLSISHSRSLGLSTRLVTNCVWAKTIDYAREKVFRLIESGLNEINFSTGDQHSRFVPLEWVYNAIVASLDHHLPVHLMIEKHAENKVTARRFLEQFALSSHVNFNLFQYSESPWMPLDPLELETYNRGETANSENISTYPGCDSILQTYVVSPNDDVRSCCGIGSKLIDEVRSELPLLSSEASSLKGIIKEAEEDFLKLWLRNEGPERILMWAANHDNSIEWENMYAHRCQACIRMYSDVAVRRVISEHYHEKIADVLAKEVVNSHVGKFLGVGNAVENT